MGEKCKNWQIEGSQKMFCFLSAYYVNFIFGFVLVVCLEKIYFINKKKIIRKNPAYCNISSPVVCRQTLLRNRFLHSEWFLRS